MVTAALDEHTILAGVARQSILEFVQREILTVFGVKKEVRATAGSGDENFPDRIQRPEY